MRCLEVRADGEVMFVVGAPRAMLSVTASWVWSPPRPIGDGARGLLVSGHAYDDEGGRSLHWRRRLKLPAAIDVRFVDAMPTRVWRAIDTRLAKRVDLRAQRDQLAREVRLLEAHRGVRRPLARAAHVAVGSIRAATSAYGLLSVEFDAAARGEQLKIEVSGNRGLATDDAEWFGYRPLRVARHARASFFSHGRATAPARVVHDAEGTSAEMLARRRSALEHLEKLLRRRRGRS